jgi:hypothetical protein
LRGELPGLLRLRICISAGRAWLRGQLLGKCLELARVLYLGEADAKLLLTLRRSLAS